MERKYEMLKNDKIMVGGGSLYRIKALRDFGDVKKGDIGGYIEKEKNLSHEGLCWVYNNAWVYGDAKISDNAQVRDTAHVSDNALVSGDARVFGHALVFNNAWVCDDAKVSDNAEIFGFANVCGDTNISHNAYIRESNDYYTTLLNRHAIKHTTFYKTFDDNINVTTVIDGHRFTYNIEDFKSKIESEIVCNETIIEESLSAIMYAKRTLGNNQIKFEPIDNCTCKDVNDYMLNKINHKELISSINVYGQFRKYEILKNDTICTDYRTLYRIKALRDFGDVKKGDIGGYIEKDDNLSHDGLCWVYNNAWVYGDAKVCDNARVRDRAQVYGNAIVSDNACVSGNTEVRDKAQVYDNAKVSDYACVCDDARVCDNAMVHGCTYIYDHAQISDDAEVSDYAWVFNHAKVYGKAKVYNDARVSDNAEVRGRAQIYGDAEICDEALVTGNAQVYGTTCVSTNARICGAAQVSDYAWVSGNAEVRDKAQVSGNAKISDEALVNGCSVITSHCEIFGKAVVSNTYADGSTQIFDDANINGVYIHGRSKIFGTTVLNNPCCNMMSDKIIMDNETFTDSVNRRIFITKVDNDELVFYINKVDGSIMMASSEYSGNAIEYTKQYWSIYPVCDDTDVSRLIKYQKYCDAIRLAIIHFLNHAIKDKINDSNKSVIERTTITSMGTLPNGSDINVIEHISIEKGEPLKKPTDDEVINALHVIQNLCEISNCKDCILSKQNTQCSILSGPPCEWKILK